MNRSSGGAVAAVQGLTRVAWNRASKWYRQVRHYGRKRAKGAREASKAARAGVRSAVAESRGAGAGAYSATVRTWRYWRRVHDLTVPRLGREWRVRRTLRRAASGTQPIIVGPWLSEVGYEVLYWVPFLRWFAERYRAHPSRLVVVSRGGVASWYAGVAERYVEMLDLFTPEEFVRRNAERQRDGEQKQHDLTAFDREILDRVRAQHGLDAASVCHPSAMFQLLRQFWLGNESLQYLLEHVRYRRAPQTPAAALPPLPPSLPDRFVAVKFYTGKALPDSETHRRLLRGLVERIAAGSPVVTLNTDVAFDEHEDYLFQNIPGVISLASAMTPQNNLAVQTEVIRRAERFVGTCGSLAWLAPMLGTETVAVYADDHMLTSHLYAARHALLSMPGAAPFTALDINALKSIQLDVSGGRAHVASPVRS